jgi:hypothetical protein
MGLGAFRSPLPFARTLGYLFCSQNSALCGPIIVLLRRSLMGRTRIPPNHPPKVSRRVPVIFDESGEWLSVPLAAERARRPYHVVWRAGISGALTTKRIDGRLYILAASLPSIPRRVPAWPAS